MKLTDTQLLLLSKATQMEGLVLLPANLKGAAAARVVNPLLANGLIKEVLSQAHMGAWRRDEATGQYYGLLITDAGRAAINAEDDSKAGEQPPAARPAAKLGQPLLGAGRKAAKQKAAKAGTRDGSPATGLTYLRSNTAVFSLFRSAPRTLRYRTGLMRLRTESRPAEHGY